MIEEAIILAAGIGSRLGLDTPKCLVNINRHTLLDMQLDLLKNIPVISIVTGFHSELIIKHIKKYHQDKLTKINFFYNEHYANTSNVVSLSLVTKKITRPTLIVMADLIIMPKSFNEYVHECQKYSSLIAITQAKSKCAIFTHLNSQNEVISISRGDPSLYEWVGMFYTNNLTVVPSKNYIFELAQENLPVMGKKIQSSEIDTQEDYENVKKFFQKFYAKEYMP